MILILGKSVVKYGFLSAKIRFLSIKYEFLGLKQSKNVTVMYGTLIRQLRL